jgi:hypothetical protein
VTGAARGALKCGHYGGEPPRSEAPGDAAGRMAPFANVDDRESFRT